MAVSTLQTCWCSKATPRARSGHSLTHCFSCSRIWCWMAKQSRHEDQTGISCRAVGSSPTLHSTTHLASIRDTTIIMQHSPLLSWRSPASSPLSPHRWESCFSHYWQQLDLLQDHEPQSLNSCPYDCWVSFQTNARTLTSTTLTTQPTIDLSMLSLCIACQLAQRRPSVSCHIFTPTHARM